MFSWSLFYGDIPPVRVKVECGLFEIEGVLLEIECVLLEIECVLLEPFLW